MNQNNQNQNKHEPVLLRQVLEYLEPKKGESYLDLTAGYGGHAEAILKQTKNFSDSVLVDRDRQAIETLETKFSKSGVTIIHDDFYHASLNLHEKSQSFDVILADLGVSSPHLNIASRGFSFMLDGPLDMRMDPRQELDAYAIVNNYSQAQLTNIIKSYGEDPKAAKIARDIVSHRPIQSTTQLAAIVAKAWPGYHAIHPATRTFQALRITVNNELELLRLSLPIWFEMLAPEGRICVISFHSLEDRIVKQAFQDRTGNTYDAEFQLLTKHPVTSDKDELAFHPRARSAKLRAAAKIKT